MALCPQASTCTLHAPNAPAPASLRGPLSDAENRYSDFMNYYSGVYIPDTTTGLLGGHCVRIVGWGEDAGINVFGWNLFY
jgi:hypothetical protein